MSFYEDTKTQKGLDLWRFKIQLRLGRKMMTSSTLVETVSINYEDFTEGFLTCNTCLNTYDGADHCPKLLSCSHTICKICLESICRQPGVSDSGSFRCPICRETIALPRDGVSTFPPSFVVNQLLDLVNRQRREVIPKCSNHVSQELLFCETCDFVFCNLCTNGTHSDSSICEHTVIPFSIAIKRMSEILLYKAHQCISKLNEAHANIFSEMRKLHQNSDHAFEDINRTFQEIINMVDRRRQEVLSIAKKMKEEKESILQSQLQMIENEKTKVESDCNGLQYQIDVRNITTKISDLNEKIDSIASLQDPRENCFIRYEHLHNSAVNNIQKAVNSFGNLRTSKTFPSSCIVTIGKCSAKVKTSAMITTYDYNGKRQASGGDPVSAELKYCKDGSNIPVMVIDNHDGTYEAHFVAPKGGTYQLFVSIFGRPVKNYPVEFEASVHINPICIYGSRGHGPHQFIQPVGLAISSQTGYIYVLDNGNCRIKVLTQSDCNNSPFNFVSHIDGLDRAVTGISLLPETDSILVSNWSDKTISEMDLNGKVVRYFSHKEFREPTYLTINSKSEIIVADNGAKAVFIFDSLGKLIKKIECCSDYSTKGGKGVGSSSLSGNTSEPPKIGVIGAIGVGPNNDIIIADSKIHIYSSQGDFIREVYPEGRLKGSYGGVTYDNNGYLLATRMEKAKIFIQVFDYFSGHLKFTIDSNDAKLKRPSSLITTNDYHVIIVDLGNDCIKKYRYQ